MYNLQLTEDEINLVWTILTNSNIAGKFAPTLSVIFNKLQDSVRLYAIQQKKLSMQGGDPVKPAEQPMPEPAAEEKRESF